MSLYSILDLKQVGGFLFYKKSRHVVSHFPNTLCHACTRPHLGILCGDLLEVAHCGADVVGAHEEGVVLLQDEHEEEDPIVVSVLRYLAFC